MRNIPLVCFITSLLGLAGCYSSSEQVGADQVGAAPAPAPASATDQRAASENVPAVSAQSDSAPAQPQATTGSAAGTAPTPAVPNTQPAR